MIDIYGSCYKSHCGDCCGDCYGVCYRAYCGDCWWVRVLFIDLACCASCLGVVGVRGDILVLKWDGACADRTYIDKAYIGKA